MKCVICKSELVEETKGDFCWDMFGGSVSKKGKLTGYSICPKCRLVYKEDKND